MSRLPTSDSESLEKMDDRVLAVLTLKHHGQAKHRDASTVNLIQTHGTMNRLVCVKAGSANNLVLSNKVCSVVN